MLSSQRLLFTLAAAAAMSACSLAHAQCETGCGTSSGSFGYPAAYHGGATGGGGYFAQKRQNFHYQMDQLHRQAEKVRARNDAWPKPFVCADRQAYHNLWNGFYEGGWITHCTLVDEHFNSETGALTKYGEAVVQGLMKNNPEGRREIFIYSGQSNIDFDAKRQSVVELVNRWYGDKGVQVSATNRWPLQGMGTKTEMTNQLYADSTPEPVIEIPTGSGSTSDTASGQ